MSRGRNRTARSSWRASAGRRFPGGGRWALPGFVLAFALLCVIVATAVGVGDPEIPPNAVAVVTGAPGGTGAITKAELARGLEQAATSKGLKAVPKPGDASYDELKERALKPLIEAVWLAGSAGELGISVTAEELAAEVRNVKATSFKTQAEYRKFVRTSRLTPADMRSRVKQQMLVKRLEEKLQSVPAPSDAEIEGFYEAAKSSKFTRPPSSDVRVIVTEDRGKAEAALAALEKDRSPASWQRLARRYSIDPATRLHGGMWRGLAEGSAESALNDAVFAAPEGRVEGPVKSDRFKLFYVFEVEEMRPATVQPLEQVKARIVAELDRQAQQENVAAFVASHLNVWKTRTYCAPGYVLETCANFRGDGHPANAPPACYEADPKGGLPKACPAPVSQLAPTLPGEVNPVKPKGQPKAQRPQPAGLKR